MNVGKQLDSINGQFQILCWDKFVHLSLVVSGTSPPEIFVFVLFETEGLTHRLIEQLSESEELLFLILQEMTANDILHMFFTTNSPVENANPTNDFAKPEC
ncbi:MAG: hypothetical protein ACE5OZ_12710 [Candidatus Heimdallarchaeota archaeon]